MSFTKVTRRAFLGGGAAALSLAALSKAEERGPAFPYYSGRSDLDSGLAAARMVLASLEPEEHFPVPEMVEMVFNREGFWMFEAQLLPILMRKGYPAGLTSLTPYDDLAAGRVPESYGPSGRVRVDREAIQWARNYAGKNIRSGKPSLQDALDLLGAGKVVMISADRRVLRNDPSLPYCRYNLVLTRATDTTITYHDPSLGPFRAAPRETIERAFNASDRALLSTGRQSSREKADKR